MAPFFVTRASVRNLKTLITRPASSLANVPSSHVSEALAAGLGCRTHAALQALVTSNPVAELLLPDTLRCKRRLVELGHDRAARTWNGFPNFLFRHGGKTPEFRTTRSKVWRNMMVAAINVGLEKKLFGYSPDDNWWTPQDSRGAEFEFLFDGRHPARALISDAHFGELTISVLLYPTPGIQMYPSGSGFKDGAAFASGWLERTLGVWLQAGGKPILECRQHLLEPVGSAGIVPNGFRDRGKLMM